ncbi:MAG TPA: cytochrome c [Eudoraea sp.]|nr:cytochrome c [Eudoraea sp.]
MNNLSKIGIVFGLVFSISACKSDNAPNYQYFPNMYEAVGYESYDEVGFLPDNSEALHPVENTIPRGYSPYEFANDIEGKELSRAKLSPLDSLQSAANLAKGRELYDIYCAICHGPKGDGQGNLVKREKILGVPNYNDAARNISVGSTYHVIYYGLNSMGSYAVQLNHQERWQVAEYVMELKKDLTK